MSTGFLDKKDRPATYSDDRAITTSEQELKECVFANWNDKGTKYCASEGIYLAWNIWSSLLFSLENSWWDLAVHHSIYQWGFVIICKNSHKVGFNVDILYSNFFRDFYCFVPRINADFWMILFSAHKKVKAVLFSVTDELTCHCSVAPRAPEMYLVLAKETDFSQITSVALSERSSGAGDETFHTVQISSVHHLTVQMDQD